VSDVVVIGLGRSGAACAQFFAREGRDVLVVDSRDTESIRARAATLPDGVRVQLGGYGAHVVDGASLVCPSPGVAWHAPELERARSLGIPVRSEIDLVFERCRGSVVGITGTNGKTTTTALVAEILSRAGGRVHLGGNIGETMLDRVDAVREGDWVVLELSSFQLESASNPACAIACVLNVTPDHLDRHVTFEAYAQAKEKIVRFARDDCVIGFDDPVARGMAGAASARVRFFGMEIAGAWGALLSGGDIVSVEPGLRTTIMPARDVPLFGAHNVLNALAAVAVSRAAGVAPHVIAAAVRGFRPVAHRLQPVLDQGGVLWVNDSKATNAESAIMALRSFGSRPIVWIGGGQTKGVSPHALADAVARHTRLAILNGATAAELEGALRARGFDRIRVTGDLLAAVRAAVDEAVPGDVVLLAPGYSSFDQFGSFEERGDAFAAQVRSLAGVAEAEAR